MDQTWEKIQHIADAGDGFFRTSEVEAAGISRANLKKYVDAGKLERTSRGIYMISNGLPDEYALLQARCSKGIFSYGTALYMLGMSDRVPHIIDLTVGQGANVATVKKSNPNVRFHYVQPEYYDLGITTAKSPQGAVVRLYDRERCICDLIRGKDQMEMQLYTQAIKEYFNQKPNSRRLLKYGKVFGIENNIRTYMEVLL